MLITDNDPQLTRSSFQPSPLIPLLCPSLYPAPRRAAGTLPPPPSPPQTKCKQIANTPEADTQPSFWVPAFGVLKCKP